VHDSSQAGRSPGSSRALSVRALEWQNVFVRLLTPRRIFTYTGAMAGMMAVFYCVSVLIGRGLTDYSGTIVGSDFLAFYTGARFWLEGRLGELYYLPSQLAFQQSVVAPVPYLRIHPFVNPPMSLPVYALFSLAGYLPGLIAWWTAGLLALVLAVALIRSELLAASGSLWRLVGACFLFYPTFAWFTFGQNTMLTLLVYTMCFVALRRRRDFVGGAILGLLAYKPQLAIGLAFMLLVQRRWRALAGGGTGLLICIAIGYAISPTMMAEYLRISPALMDFIRFPDYPSWGLHSLFGLAVLLFDSFSRPMADVTYFLLTAAALGLLASFWWRRRWEPGTRAWDLSMAATITLGVVISPHLFLYDLALLLLPLFIVWSHYRAGAYPAAASGAWRPLDGGPLLVLTAALWLVTFAGSYLSAGEVKLTQALGWGRIALQLSVPVVVGWAWLVHRLSQQPANGSVEAPVGGLAKIRGGNNAECAQSALHV
jgi:hypothetical protein